MTNSKSTKRALLTSSISLLLCFAMLLGTTFAWFTDSVSTGINTIQAGNLDIGVYYATPADVVDGDVPAEKWTPVTAEESIFNNNALWEPGYTETVFLKFVNEGSLALQYQFKVDIIEEVIGKNKDGKDIQLSKFINAYICNNFEWNYKNYLFADRNSATNPAGAPNPFYDTLYNAANAGVNRADNYTENALSLDSWQWLDPTETTYATLVLWMPETVGNEANHNGTDIPKIDLGVNVLATQYNWEKEKDSYDHNYDKDATYPAMPDYQVTTADKLIEAIDKAGQGETIALMKDIKIESASLSNSYGKTGINITNGQILDGGNKSLGVNAWSTWDSAISTTGGAIKNITINNGMRGIFINHNSTYSEPVILENVTVDGTVYTISCDQGTNKGLKAYNSTFKGWTSYAATIGDVVFTNCTFGKGQGYNFSRPYAPTEYVGCNFEEGHEMDPRAAVTFENCTIGGVALTADNLATLVTSNIANATVK